MDGMGSMCSISGPNAGTASPEHKGDPPTFLQHKVAPPERQERILERASRGAKVVESANTSIDLCAHKRHTGATGRSRRVFALGHLPLQQGAIPPQITYLKRWDVEHTANQNIGERINVNLPLLGLLEAESARFEPCSVLWCSALEPPSDTPSRCGSRRRRHIPTHTLSVSSSR